MIGQLDLSSEKINYYENVHILKNAATNLPPGIQNFESHDRPHYNRIRVIKRRVITRADCVMTFRPLADLELLCSDWPWTVPRSRVAPGGCRTCQGPWLSHAAPRGALAGAGRYGRWQRYWWQGRDASTGSPWLQNNTTTSQHLYI